jgi:hypothetical protein
MSWWLAFHKSIVIHKSKGWCDMFYAIGFFESDFGKSVARAIRAKGYDTAKAAQRAIEKKGITGYVKRLGCNKPIWSNLDGT